MTIEAMKQALEALDEAANVLTSDMFAKAADDLRTAIKEAEKQEPVAWCIVENGRVHGLVKTKPAVMNAEKWQPLYTAPRQWQGLTDEEIDELRAALEQAQAGIETLHAMYKQACQQRDQLMDQQRAQVAAIRGRVQ